MTRLRPDPETAPIFVVGPSRSGTTLLRSLLNAHPRIHLTHEASFYLLPKMLVLPRGYDATDWLEHYVQLPQFRYLNLDANGLRDPRPGRLDRREIPRLIRRIMRLRAQRYGRVRFGDKTPTHAGFLKEILRDFPDARVVHIARDPRATVASLLRMPWSSPSIGTLAQHVDGQLKRALTQGHRVHEVRLESLIEDPAGTLHGVLDFVGEDWDDDVLDPTRFQPPDDLPPFPWFSRAKGPPRARSGPPLWQRQLSGVWIRTIERTNRFAMERYGYGAAPLPREPRPLEYLSAYAADVTSVLHTARAFLTIVYHLQRYGLRRPDCYQELLLNTNPAAWQHYPGFTLPDPTEGPLAD